MKDRLGFINVNNAMESIDNKFGKLLMTRGIVNVNTFKNISLCLYTFKFINPDKYRSITENSVDLNTNIYKEISSEFDKVGLNGVFEELVNADFSINSTIQLRNFVLFIEDLCALNLAYKEGFDQLIFQFSKHEGKITSVFNTPETICSLFNILVGESETIFDPTCGTGSLLNSFQSSRNVKLFGQEVNKDVISIAKLRFVFDENINLKNCNSLLDNDDSSFDTVILNPPFNLRIDSFEYDQMPYLNFGTPSRSNANFYWLQYGLSKLNEEGKCIILLSNNSQNSSGADAEIRSRIIKAGLVEAIIALPSNLFDFTGIPATIWVLNKKRLATDSVLFIDSFNWGEFETRNRKRLIHDEIELIGNAYRTYNSTNQIEDSFSSFAKIVKVSELADNNYVLTPNRYFSDIDSEISEYSNLVELRNFLTPFNRSIPFSTSLKTKKISVKDLSASSDQFTINVDSLDDYTGEHRVVGFDDEVIIIARVGDKLKPSYLPFNGKDVGFSLLNVYAFTINREKVHIDYLIQELNKPYVYKQLDRYRSTGTVPTIRLEDLLSLKINLLDLIEQEKSVKEEKEIRFQELAKLHGFENEIVRLKELQRKDLGSKKHNIMQHLNNVKSSSEIFRKMLIKNNGILKATDVINPTTGVTVEDRLVKLQESIESVLYFVDNLTNEISFDKLEVVNLYELIKECIQKGIQNDHFEIIDDSDLDSFEEYAPNVEISKRDFEELYNNILENAINHGFVNSDSRYIFRFSVAIVKNQVELLFENNGKPFPKGMGEIERFSTRGEKAGVTANTGEGSWKVAQIANHFNAELSIIDEPENEYPVGIKLVFKLSE
jgi:type I restriction-modification system DNA methylase subunit